MTLTLDSMFSQLGLALVVANVFLETRGEKLDEFYYSTATPLPDHRVLIVGGRHAWIYEP